MPKFRSFFLLSPSVYFASLPWIFSHWFTASARRNDSFSMRPYFLSYILGLGGDRSFRVPGTKRSLIVDSLSPDTQYRIVVLAENPYGQGPQAEGVYTRTSKSFRARTESSKPEEGKYSGFA